MIKAVSLSVTDKMGDKAQLMDKLMGIVNEECISFVFEFEYEGEVTFKTLMEESLELYGANVRPGTPVKDTGRVVDSEVDYFSMYIDGVTGKPFMKHSVIKRGEGRYKGFTLVRDVAEGLSSDYWASQSFTGETMQFGTDNFVSTLYGMSDNSVYDWGGRVSLERVGSKLRMTAELDYLYNSFIEYYHRCPIMSFVYRTLLKGVGMYDVHVHQARKYAW